MNTHFFIERAIFINRITSLITISWLQLITVTITRIIPIKVLTTDLHCIVSQLQMNIFVFK